MKLLFKISLFLFVLNSILLTNVYSGIDSLKEKEIIFKSGKFKYMLETADQFYYDTLNMEAITDAAYRTLLNSMDIQSIYYSKLEFQKLQDQNKGDAEGIGIDIVPLSDTLTIIKVIGESPADSAGLAQGDKILFIDGKNAIGMAKAEADTLIRGIQGTKVALIVKRQNGTGILNEFHINRSEYNLPSVTADFMLDDKKTGYILISRFSIKTNNEFSDALKFLKKEGMQNLIIDLRGNLGGIVESTLNALANFFPEKTQLLKIKGRNKTIDTTIYSSFEGKYQNIKILILVDRNSASASEIFSGVIQDYDHGVIIGENTYGKGTVQKIWKMNDGSGFRLTIAEYETPSGRHIQKPKDSTNFTSLDPSLELNLTKDERDKILEIYKKTGGKSIMQTVRTTNGRVIIASGGVYPDIYEKADTVNLLTRVLNQKGILLEYVYNFISTEKGTLLAKYKNDFKSFNKEYVIEDSFLEGLKKFSYSKNIWNEIYFEQDKEYIRNLLKALIAYSLWEDNGFKAVMFNKDNVFQKALSVIPEYDKYLK